MRTRPTIIVSVVALGVAAGIVVACSDSAISPVDRGRRPPSTDEQTNASRSRVAAEFHRRNRMDWVGEAHSLGIDHFRVALRAHRIKPNQLCKVLPNLLAEDEARLPMHRSLARARAVDAARDGMTHGICAQRRIAAPTVSAFLPIASPLGSALQAASVAVAPAMLSPTIEELLDQIAIATSVANSSPDLAVALGQITEQAATLEPAAQDAVLGAASLALSSTQYWEVNYESFSYEVISEQPCINAQTCEAAYSVARAPILVPTPQERIRQIAQADLSAGSWVIVRYWILGPMAWEGAGLAAAAASVVKAVGVVLDDAI